MPLAKRNRDPDHEIIILGTAHYLHTETKSYPLWEIKSVILEVQPDIVLVEIRPSAIATRDRGEGPIEMPFCAFVAKEAGFAVGGMDDWSEKMEVRENHMMANILKSIQGTKRALVITGFSHVPAFLKRLQARGYRKEPWPELARQQLFLQPVKKEFPQELAKAYRAAIKKAERGENAFNSEWSARRLAFLRDANLLE